MAAPSLLTRAANRSGPDNDAAQNRGLNLPLEAALRSRLAIGGNGAHAAAAALMSDEAGVKVAWLGERKAEQEFDLALRNAVARVHALVADDEIALLRRAAGECALQAERFEKCERLLLRTFPGGC